MDNHIALAFFRRKLLLLLLTLVFLTGCLPAPFGPTATPTVTLTSTATFTPLPPTETPTPTATPVPPIRRVLIVSFDGLRPDAIAQVPMPNLQALMQTGAYSLTAQTIYPSGTLMAHASMLTGLCPSKHGIDWNYYDLTLGYATGPSLLSLAHDTGMVTIMVVGKDKLRQITEPENTDGFIYINDRGQVIAQQIADNFPASFGVLFVHFPTADWMGHEHGWMSWQYMDVLRQDDQALQMLLDKLDETGLRDETLVIVTSDHGGHENTNGSNLPEDMTIPWVISGPGVVPGELTIPINTTDTAATAAWALGLDLPAEWDGIPAYEAFGQVSPERPAPRCP